MATEHTENTAGNSAYEASTTQHLMKTVIHCILFLKADLQSPCIQSVPWP